MGLGKNIKFLNKFYLFYLNFITFLFNKQILKNPFFKNTIKDVRKIFSFKDNFFFIGFITIFFKNSFLFDYSNNFLSKKNSLTYIYEFKKRRPKTRYILEVSFSKKKKLKKKIFFKNKHTFVNSLSFFKKNFLKINFINKYLIPSYHHIFFQTSCIIFKKGKNKSLIKKFTYLKVLHNSDKNDFLTNDPNKKLIELQKQYVLKQKYFFFINTFLHNFLNFFLKKKLFFSLKKLNGYFKDQFKIFKKPFLFFKLKKKIKNFKSISFIKTFYKIFYISLKLKDGLFFLKWFTLKIEDSNFKKHKNYIHFFHSFLKIFHKNLFSKTKTLGAYFSISGKIGVTGDSKKRKIFFNYGMHSSSRKNLKLNLSRTQVKTKTGVMGISYNIFF